jgi:uncharacterized sulfatase
MNFSVSYNIFSGFCLSVILFSCLFGVLLTSSCQDNTDNEKPNILLILTDDQGYSTLGCYGGEIVPTPNLDKFATEGVMFTNAYVTSQCTPTRATLLTGQYTARHGLWHVLPWYGYPNARMTEAKFAEHFPRSTYTIAKGLRSVGYKTGIFGKWHLTSNEDGHYMGLNPEAAHYYGFDFAPPVLSRDEFVEGADRGVNTLTGQALDFIESNTEKPWFVYLSHHMIHGKVVAPEELTNQYREKGYTDEGPNRAVYLAGLEHIDHSIGRLMTRLEELGEDENTIIIFLSDNGGIDWRLGFKDLPVPNPENPILEEDIIEYDNYPLRAGKGSAYEGGIRVPMLVRWPGKIKTGHKVKVPVHAVDIAPTLFNIAGVNITDATQGHFLDGEDIMPLLKNVNSKDFTDRAIFQYYPFYDLRWGLTPCATIHKGKYKLIEFFGDRFETNHQYIPGHRIELYNLKEDIGETINLIEIEPDKTQELLSELHAWMEEMNVAASIANPYYNPDSMFVETKIKPDWIDW